MGFKNTSTREMTANLFLTIMLIIIAIWTSINGILISGDITGVIVLVMWLLTYALSKNKYNKKSKKFVRRKDEKSK